MWRKSAGCSSAYPALSVDVATSAMYSWFHSQAFGLVTFLACHRRTAEIQSLGFFTEDNIRGIHILGEIRKLYWGVLLTLMNFYC